MVVMIEKNDSDNNTENTIKKRENHGNIFFCVKNISGVVT